MRTYLKHTILSLATVSLLASCGGNTTDPIVEQETPGHLISGTIKGAEGEKVKLMVFEEGKEKFIDSALIVDGSYQVHTQTNELREYILFVGSDVPIILFLDESSDKNINVSGSVPGIGENYTVTGSAHSQDLHKYMLFINEHYDLEMELIGQVNATDPADKKKVDQLMARLDSISAIQRDYAIQEIRRDSTSPVSWMLLRELVPTSGVANMDSTDIQYFKMVSNGMKSKYPYTEYVTYIDNDIASITAQQAQKNAPPALAPDIKLKDVNGKELALSSLRGKVVLLDFWASWCGPCRKENPNVVRMYEKYKNKGFTVYSVSLDEDKTRWTDAIKADNLSWPNHVSDLKGWASEGAALYNVQSIPATFLIDENGMVIAQNLRGAELEQKLQEILD